MGAVLPKRADDNGTQRRTTDDTAITSESLRFGSTSPQTATPSKGDDEKMSLFWRVFGGAIISVITLIVITLFNNLMATLTEIRSEINRINEHRAELVKKDEFTTQLAATWDRVQNLQTQNNTQNAALTSYRTELDGYKERLTKQANDIEAARKETLATLESLKKDMSAIEILKERVAALSADMKGQREEHQKLRHDVDKNQTADQERKALRDEQFRELDKALKAMQAAIQDCQVKLARLEGQTTPKPESPKSASVSAGEHAGAPPDHEPHEGK
jgi:DNA repair exonuclease SbcCD ATPase subunit